MAIANGLRRNVKLENVGLEFIAKSIWRTIFKKAMNVKSIDTWYPFFDEKAFAFKDLRELFRVSNTQSDNDRRRIKFKYTKRQIMLDGYNGNVERSNAEIRELRSMDINKAMEADTRGAMGLFNTFYNLDIAALFTDTGIWNNDAPVNKYDTATGDIQKDYLNKIKPAVKRQSRSTREPNTWLLSDIAYGKIVTNTITRDLIKHTGLPIANATAALKQLLGIENIIVLDATYDVAKKGQTADMTSIWTTDMWFGYLDSNPNEQNPSAAMALVPEDETGNDEGLQIVSAKRPPGSKFEDGKDGYRMFVDAFVNFKQTSELLGYLWTDTYTP